MANNELTQQQKQFVDEYLKLRKRYQGQAAINAGYSPRTADSQASQLLKKPKIQEYLKEREKLIERNFRKEFLFDALEAREVLYSIMNDEEARDRDKIVAAKDFLDRAGFKPVEKSEMEVNGKVDIGERADEIKAYLEGKYDV